MLNNEPTSAQQAVIDEIRASHHTVGCARCLPYGTHAWIVAVFDDDRQEIKRWRVLPNGDTYEVLPGTPSADQKILPPDDEPITGDSPLPSTPTTGVWIVYGLLANREDGHDLRFITRSRHPQRVADEHADTYDACLAFPETDACQLDPGARFEIAPVASLLGRARWPNAAERAGR